MSELPEILLVPVDGSKGARAAAIFAGKMAQKLDVPVRLLFAFPKTALDMMGGALELPNTKELRYFSPEYFAEMRDKSAEAAFQPAREALAGLGGTAVSIEEQVIGGDAGEAILEHAAANPAAMIIIGRRGLSRFREIVLGSVTQRVLHHAKCPVLVVR